MTENPTRPWYLLGKVVKLTYKGNPVDASTVTLKGEVTGVHLTMLPNADEFAVMLSLGSLDVHLSEWKVVK
jgi:hypothetical protein